LDIGRQWVRSRAPAVGLRQACGAQVLSGVCQAHTRLGDHFPHRFTSKIFQRFRPYWQRIWDNNLCLVCLDQAPEYTLPCSHMMCEACVQRYWSNDEHPWVFKLEKCLLCRSIFPQRATVKIRDPSRGLRVDCSASGLTNTGAGVSPWYKPAGTSDPLCQRRTLCYQLKKFIFDALSRLH
jgi:Zinc finger, C3HC4 type (RING finger)